MTITFRWFTAYTLTVAALLLLSGCGKPPNPDEYHWNQGNTLQKLGTASGKTDSTFSNRRETIMTYRQLHYAGYDSVVTYQDLQRRVLILEAEITSMKSWRHRASKLYPEMR